VSDAELLSEALRAALARDRLGRLLQVHHRPLGPVDAWGWTEDGEVLPLDGYDHGAGPSCPCDPVLLSTDLESDDVERVFREALHRSES
jgi:hypothetical protein